MRNKEGHNTQHTIVKRYVQKKCRQIKGKQTVKKEKKNNNA